MKPSELARRESTTFYHHALGGRFRGLSGLIVEIHALHLGSHSLKQLNAAVNDLKESKEFEGYIRIHNAAYMAVANVAAVLGYGSPMQGAPKTIIREVFERALGAKEAGPKPILWLKMHLNAST